MTLARRSLLLLLLVGLLLPLVHADAGAAPRDLYVATTGSNSNPGTITEPYATIQYGAARALPGDTVYVRGGTYIEGAGGATDSGTASAPITLTNYPGEYVLLKGALRFTDTDWWIVDGINVTDDPTRTPGSLVAFSGGSNWILRNSEIWGTRGTANVLIKSSDTEPAENFLVTNNCIHDADDAADGDKQSTDHNIYLFPGLDGDGGTIERNILFGAPNGANIKIGGPGDGRGPANVTMRFNTMGSGAAGVIVYRDGDANLVTRNLFTKHINGDETYNGAAVSILATGETNRIKDNAWHDHPNGFRDHGTVGNAFEVTGHRQVETGFDAVETCDGYRPTDDTAALYGRYAQDEPLPTELAPSFVDTAGNVFENDIDWLASEGITAGCNPPTNDRFCPDAAVTRGAMAAFLVRALSLDPSSVDRFDDDDNSVFESNIQALAAAGITAGCNPPANTRYCPDADVTRGAMAAFLVRALDLPSSSADAFDDDDSSVFESNIQALAKAGITAGCNPPTNDRFCPTSTVTRGQMAAFLKRALG